jgi:D-glycero-alpha-D-manno-heptose 1-phosphate guanylyltransferase
MKALVLAGGLGTRLKQRVPDLPKPMAPVAGRPFLEYILDRLILGGITEIILSVGYRADVITSHFKDVYKNAKITYAIESEPLGTGGAIANALSGLNVNNILIVNGDTLVDIDYSNFIKWYLATPDSFAIVLKEISDVNRYGSIIINEGIITGFHEKGQTGPGLINAGVYLISTSIFNKYSLNGSFSLERDILQKNCSILCARAFMTNSYFIDIGIPDDYDKAQYELPKLINL